MTARERERERERESERERERKEGEKSGVREKEGRTVVVRREGRREGEMKGGVASLLFPPFTPSLSLGLQHAVSQPPPPCKLTSFFTSRDQMLLSRSIWQNLKLFAGEYWRKVETGCCGDVLVCVCED